MSRNDFFSVGGGRIYIFLNSFYHVSFASGPVVYQSWKYPDKKSNEVNISDLLELYDFSEDEEDNQVAHIVLLELVVDRS